MDRLYLRGFAQRDADTDPDGPLRFIIATEGRKADGLDLRMDGLNLDRFLANPVVMYGHDYFGRDSLPIGRAENVHVEKGNLLADTVFDTDDPFAAEVDRKYRGGFLNAVSVGFDIGKLDPETGIVETWELIEYSAVPIPLDPDAVVADGRARALALAGDLLGADRSLVGRDQQIVRDAITSLQALVDDTTDDPSGTDDEPRGLSLAAARLRLEHLEQLDRI